MKRLAKGLRPKLTANGEIIANNMIRYDQTSPIWHTHCANRLGAQFP
jgi:hypothetical protein